MLRRVAGSPTSGASPTGGADRQGAAFRIDRGLRQRALLNTRAKTTRASTASSQPVAAVPGSSIRFWANPMTAMTLLKAIAATRLRLTRNTSDTPAHTTLSPRHVATVFHGAGYVR